MTERASHITYRPGVQIECDCTEEYGPCEEHGVTVVQREGASTRTADELVICYIEDAWVIGVEVSPWGQDVIDRANLMMPEVDEFAHTAWLPTSTEGDRMRDELMTLADQVESDMACMDAPHFTYWDDGYRVVRVLDGCLLLDN